MNNPNEQSVQKLNSFLRGELSAVETYRQAISAVRDPQAQDQLRTCAQSHQERVTALKKRIMEMGGTPDQTAGAWGAFAQAVEGSAKAMGETAAIQALEQGEDHGLNDYRKGREALDATTREFLDRELLPAQEKTHGALSMLKRTLH